MKSPIFAACLLLTISQAAATDRWRFDTRVAVGDEPQSGVFHHLDGAGRNHLAISEGIVAATWEDNRDKSPQVYVALLPAGQQKFGQGQRVSGGAEAYEPAIAALPGERFVIAWEQDGGVHARLLEQNGLKKTLTLAPSSAGHVSLATRGDEIFAAWREQRQRRWYLQVAALRASAVGELEVLHINPVESDGLETRLLLPSITLNDAGLCIAWEDRRAGHTRLLVSYSADSVQSFSEPQNLNEFFSNRNQYDQGNGVTRVALASFAEDEIIAAWMDKRRGGSGYGIYAALGADGGDMFGPNEKVHGEQGDRQPHYNPAVAGNPVGDFAVAWDDFRTGDSDIWLSTYNEDEEWSRDFAPKVASGAGEQSHPSILLDDEGNLHLLWLERSDMNAPSRLWYSRGVRRELSVTQ